MFWKSFHFNKIWNRKWKTQKWKVFLLQEFTLSQRRNILRKHRNEPCSCFRSLHSHCHQQVGRRHLRVRGMKINIFLSLFLKIISHDNFSPQFLIIISHDKFSPQFLIIISHDNVSPPGVNLRASNSAPGAAQC